MIRILKFFGAFLLVLIALLGTVYLFNKRAVDSVFRNDLSEGTEFVPLTYSLRGFVKYMAENPEGISLVSLRGDAPDSSVFYGAKTARSLGNLTHLMLLASYTDAVSRGEISPDEPVDHDLLRAFHVPGHEVNAHSSSLRTFERSENHTIDQLAILLAVDNDAAFADYLYHRLGLARIAEIPTRFGLHHTQAPLPWSGILLAWDPRVQGKSFAELEAEYLSMDDSVYHANVAALGQRYLQDAGYRKEVEALLKSGEPILFAQEKRRHAMTTKAQPAEYAEFIRGLLDGELLSPAAREHLLRILTWPMENAKTASEFERYAAIYDSRMGYLAGVDFGMRRGETQATAQVFIMENIPIGLFLHLSSNLMNQDFQQRLIWDPELHTVVYEDMRDDTVRVEP